jgi:hypothetical protein
MEESRAEIQEKELKKMAEAKRHETEAREREESKIINRIGAGAGTFFSGFSKLVGNENDNIPNSRRCKVGLHNWSEKDYYTPARMMGPGWNLSDITNPPDIHYRQTCTMCGKIKEGKESRGNRVFSPK